MNEITIHVGKKYLVMSPERRADLNKFATTLRAADYAVVLEIVDYEPGRRGLSFNQPEAVAIYIGGAAGGALISALVTDLYNRTKEWATARFRKKVEDNPEGLHRPEQLTIYGPSGEILKSWTIDEEGEHDS